MAGKEVVVGGLDTVHVLCRLPPSGRQKVLHVAAGNRRECVAPSNYPAALRQRAPVSKLHQIQTGIKAWWSSVFNLLTDLDDHQIFAEFQWTGVGLPRRWKQILLGGVWQHDG